MSEITRREIMAAAVAGIAIANEPASAQTQPPTTRRPFVDSRLALIEEAWGEAMSDDLRRQVAASIVANDSAWINNRARLKVPHNVEPAFVFSPTESTRG